MMQAARGNPFFQILQTVKNGQNPMPLMYQFARQTPAFSQPLRMIDGKDIASQRQSAFNMAKEYGIDLNKFAAQFGLTLPK